MQPAPYEKPNLSWHFVNVLGLLFLAFVITDPFELQLLFYDTILTGGDAGSWYQIAIHLKDSLLPNARLFGWDQGNFFGYSNLQHYFVLPFLMVVVLSYLIPLTIALKLITVSGFFVMPFVVYWALKKLDYKNPIPLCGAWLILIFLFHERYSMFGGNLLSTLAGEFCYSIAFTLLVAYVAVLLNDAKNKNFTLNSGLLLGLIGLSHAFVFMVAALMPLYFLLVQPNRKTLKLISVNYLVAFLIMAFWVLPMLYNLEFTTPIKMIWRFGDVADFLHNAHYEIVLVALLIIAVLRFKKIESLNSGFFTFGIVVSVLLYLIATALKIPDIRFFPPLLFFSLLVIIDAVARLLQYQVYYHKFASISVIGLSIVMGGYWVYSQENATKWFQWNYTGYETKRAFIDGRAANLFSALEGTYNDPRVAWEQGAHASGFGTVRVFENIPLFTGRASTEGIHYASGMLSLPITMLHGEYSLTPASPSANIYSHYFIDTLPDRFRMLNIREFVAYSDEITDLLKDSGEYEVINETPPYTIFSWKNYDTAYVVTPKYKPVLAVNLKDWKRRFDNWFRRGDNIDLTIINGGLVRNPGSELLTLSQIDLQKSGIVSQAKRVALEPANITNIQIQNTEMSFKTDKPGTPHVVKVAFSPNWKSSNDEEIYMIAPGFMMLYPETENVLIEFRRHWIENVGIVLTCLGMLLILVYSINKKKVSAAFEQPIFENVISGLIFIRKPFVIIAVILVFVTSIWSFQAKQDIYSDYMAGNMLNIQDKKLEAIEKFKENVSIENILNIDDVDVPSSIYALARNYRELGQLKLAKVELGKIVKYYPRWTYIDEIYWYLGSIAVDEGDKTLAINMFENCLKIEKFRERAKRCEIDMAKLL